MDKEKQVTRERFMHRCAVCGRAAAMLSIVVLAKRLRDRRHSHHHHRFAILGH